MSNVKTIAMSIVAHNHAGGVLAGIIGHLAHMQHLMTQNNLALGRFRTALVGIGAAWAGTTILKDMKHMVDQAATLQQIQNRMALQGTWGRPDRDGHSVSIPQATQAAWDLSAKYPTLTPQNVLSMIMEMSPVLGSPSHALEMSEIMARMEVNLQSVLGEQSHAALGKMIKDAVRSGELSGNAMEMRRFEKYIDGMVKGLHAFGGTISPSDYFMAFKYARSAGLGWSDDFVNYILPTAMQQMGGSSTGNAMMGLHQALVGGHMTRVAIAEWERLGILDPAYAKESNMTPEGHLKKWDSKAVHGLDKYKANPFQFFTEDVIGQMIAKGDITAEGWKAIQSGQVKDGLGGETRNKIVDVLTKLFSNRVPQGQADQFIIEVAKFMRDSDLLTKSYGSTPAIEKMMKDDYQTNMRAFHAQWERLVTALGGPMVGQAVGFMTQLNGALTQLGTWAQRNPEDVRAWSDALVIMGVGLTALSGVLIGGAIFAALGPGGWFVLGITAIAAALNQMGWLKDLFSKTTAAKQRDAGSYVGPGGIVLIPRNAAAEDAAKGSMLRNGFEREAPGGLMGLGSKMGEALGFKMTEGAGQAAQRTDTGPFQSTLAAKLSAAAAAAAAAMVVPSFGGLDGTRGGIQKQSFVPPSTGSRVIQTHATINMDGRKVGEGVTRHVVQEASYPRGSPAFDGVMNRTPVDYTQV